MSKRTLVVGDVHGCLQELQDLLKVAGFTDEDRLVLAGDLVAKGPDSQGVVQLAREKAALGVMGNHDAHVLKARQGVEMKKAHAAAAKSLRDADWEYLEQLPLLLEFNSYDAVVVHAGLAPGVPFNKQPKHFLLNLRSIDERGEPSTRIEGVPWASRWKGPKLVVFGHDAVRGLQQHPFAFGLDTGCVYGGRLTGLWLPERRLVSVPARKVWSPSGE